MHPFAYAALYRVARRKRICEKCKREQIVSVDKVQEDVACKFCGARMPAAKRINKQYSSNEAKYHYQKYGRHKPYEPEAKS